MYKNIRKQITETYLYVKNQLLKNTFHKHERLCSKKEMDLLFKKGISVSKSPLKLILLPLPHTQQSFPNRIMFVVPKRAFKRANKRNILKRRMREAYRLNKVAFYNDLNEKNVVCVSALIYTGVAITDYDGIEKATKQLLNSVVNKIK